jgi:hypothetical protein
VVGISIASIDMKRPRLWSWYAVEYSQDMKVESAIKAFIYAGKPRNASYE